MKYLLIFLLSFLSFSIVNAISIESKDSKVYVYGEDYSISTRDIGQCYGLQDGRYVKMSYKYNQIEHKESFLSGIYLYLDNYRCDINNYKVIETGFNLIEHKIEKKDGKIVYSGLVFNFDQGCLQETPGNQIKSITISYTSGEIRYDLRQGINYTRSFGTCRLLSVEEYKEKQEELSEKDKLLLSKFKKLFSEYMIKTGDKSLMAKILLYKGEQTLLIKEIMVFVLNY